MSSSPSSPPSPPLPTNTTSPISATPGDNLRPITMEELIHSYPHILPKVSVCTPTFNRRPFIPAMLEMFRQQTYPHSRMEWIIVDDGTDCVRELILGSQIPEIRYVRLNEKVSLGAKRNITHHYCSPDSDIIVYMDDDDYYPPERVEHAVEMLLRTPTVEVAGCNELYLAFRGIDPKRPQDFVLYKAGPYHNPYAVTAASMAFRRSFLTKHRYDEFKSLSEEGSFLEDFTVPVVPLDTTKTILVFPHDQNTFDKRIMLRDGISEVFKPTTRFVGEFTGRSRVTPHLNLHLFFTRDMYDMLPRYLAGSTNNKPDVVVQLKHMEIERNNLRSKIDAHNRTVMAQRANERRISVPHPNGDNVDVTLDEAGEIIRYQHNTIMQLIDIAKHCADPATAAAFRTYLSGATL